MDTSSFGNSETKEQNPFDSTTLSNEESLLSGTSLFNEFRGFKGILKCVREFVGLQKDLKKCQKNVKEVS